MTHSTLGARIGDLAARHAWQTLRAAHEDEWQRLFTEKRDQLRVEMGWRDTRSERAAAQHAEAVEDRRDVILLVARLSNEPVTAGYLVDMTKIPLQTVREYLHRLEGDGAVRCVGRASDQGRSKLWEVAS